MRRPTRGEQRLASHHAIFSSAMARYKKYGPKNQLRTWHEVVVLSAAGQILQDIKLRAGERAAAVVEAERGGVMSGVRSVQTRKAPPKRGRSYVFDRLRP